MHPHGLKQVSGYDSSTSEFNPTTFSLETQLDFGLNVDVIIDFSAYFEDDAIFSV